LKTAEWARGERRRNGVTFSASLAGSAVETNGSRNPMPIVCSSVITFSLMVVATFLAEG